MDFEPMLAKSIDPKVLGTYASNPAWYMEQKLDGMRIVIEVNDGQAVGYNRSGEYVTLDPRFTQPFLGFDGHWVFDSEVVLGVIWLFDLAEALTKITHDTPFRERRSALEAVYETAFGEDHPYIKLVDTARTAKEKKALITRVQENNGEGIMIKSRSGTYEPQAAVRGKRSSGMLKAKFTETADCIIGDVGREGKASCSLFVYDENGSLREIGSCKMTELNLRRVKMGDVVEIRYLYVWNDLRLVQPRFVRFREDKHAEDCTIDQLKMTDKTVLRKAHR